MEAEVRSRVLALAGIPTVGQRITEHAVGDQDLARHRALILAGVEVRDVDLEFRSLMAAIDEVCEFRRYNPDQARISKGHVGGGRFGSKLTAALESWLKGEGPDDPDKVLAGVSWRTIRKAAVAHGVQVPARVPTSQQGAVKAALLEAVRQKRVAGKPEAEKLPGAPAGHKRFTIKVNGKSVDVGVFGNPDTGQVWIRRESDQGVPGAQVGPKHADVAALGAWAREQGYKDLADYADAQGSPAPDTGSADKPAPKAPAKKAAPAKAAKTAAPKGNPAAGSELIGRDGGTSLAAAVAALPGGQARGAVTEPDQFAKRGPRGDEWLAEIAHRQGFDGPAATASSKSLDDAVAAGGVELWRGSSAVDGADTSVAGDVYYGFGITANGIHTSTSRVEAERHAGDSGKVERLVLRPGARITTVDAMQERLRELVPQDARFTDDPRWQVFSDPGRLAAALGYDALYNPRDGRDNYILLNRTALMVEPSGAKPSKTASPSPSTDLADRLRNASSRDEAAKLLKGKKKAELQAIAKDIGAPFTSKTTNATLTAAILDEAGHGEALQVGESVNAPAAKPGKSLMSQMTADERRVARKSGLPDDHPLALLADQIDTAPTRAEAERLVADLHPDDARQVARELGIEVPPRTSPDDLKAHIVQSVLTFGNAGGSEPVGQSVNVPNPDGPTEAEKLAAGYPDVPAGVDVAEDQWSRMSYNERLKALVAARVGAPSRTTAQPTSPAAASPAAHFDAVDLHRELAARRTGGKTNPDMAGLSDDQIAAEILLQRRNPEVDRRVFKEGPLPPDTRPANPDGPAREAEVDNRIRQAYRDLRRKPDAWVSIADLREHPLIRDLDRSEVDAALKALVDKPGDHVIPEMSQGELTARDRAAAVQIAGEANHYFKVSDSSPNPDGLDSLEGSRLRSYATEWDIPTSGKTDDEIRQALRDQGIESPEREREKRAAEDAAKPAAPTPATPGRPLTDEETLPIQQAIRDAYARLAQKPGDDVSLAAIRRELGDRYPRRDVDLALRYLNRQKGVVVDPEANQKLLTDAEHDAAVIIGNQPKHTIAIRSAAVNAEQRDRTLRLLGVTRAAGMDTHPGGEQLRRYWTEDPEGLAKWVGHPHEWTALRDHLLKYMTPEKADRVAADWFHRVKGFWPGSDLHRVEHGKPPRGHLVGPG